MSFWFNSNALCVMQDALSIAFAMLSYNFRAVNGHWNIIISNRICIRYLQKTDKILISIRHATWCSSLTYKLNLFLKNFSIRLVKIFWSFFHITRLNRYSLNEIVSGNDQPWSSTCYRFMSFSFSLIMFTIRLIPNR